MLNEKLIKKVFQILLSVVVLQNIRAEKAFCVIVILQYLADKKNEDLTKYGFI